MGEVAGLSHQLLTVPFIVACEIAARRASVWGVGVVSAAVLRQGFVDNLLADITAVFPVEQIMTPPEHRLRLNGTWPSIDEMAAAGKRVLFISSTDYGESMFPLVFSRWDAAATWCSPSREIKITLCNHGCVVSASPHLEAEEVSAAPSCMLAPSTRLAALMPAHMTVGLWLHSARHG